MLGANNPRQIILDELLKGIFKRAYATAPPPQPMTAAKIATKSVGLVIEKLFLIASVIAELTTDKIDNNVKNNVKVILFCPPLVPLFPDMHGEWTPRPAIHL